MCIRDRFKTLQSFSGKLDDELNTRDWGFYTQFSVLYQKAVKRADSILQKLTAKPFDFVANETISTGKKDVFVFAADGPALVSRWSRYLRFKALDALHDISSLDTTGKKMCIRDRPNTITSLAWVCNNLPLIIPVTVPTAIRLFSPRRRIPTCSRPRISTTLLQGART